MAKQFPPDPPKGYESETPFVNMNGDRPEVLTDQFETVASEIRRLLTLMSENAPHGRNFVSQDKFFAAQEKFRADVAAIAAIENKYSALAEYTAAFIK